MICLARPTLYLWRVAACIPVRAQTAQALRLAGYAPPGTSRSCARTVTIHRMISWGDVPTWVAAVGTVGTLALALLQIASERNRRLAADEQLRADRHVAQARLVAAYLGDELQTPDADPRGADNGRTEVFLVNNSPEPVYTLAVGIVFVQGAAPPSLEEMLELNRDQYQGRRGPITTVKHSARRPLPSVDRRNRLGSHHGRAPRS